MGNLKVMVKSTVVGALRTISKSHPNNNIVQVGQNTEKSPEDLKKESERLSVNADVKNSHNNN